MDLVEYLRTHGGVARISTLNAAGFRRSAIERAIGRRRVNRIARGWVALPLADPTFIAAAEVGVTVTCVSQAERRGLWSFGAAEPHVAADPHAKLKRATTAHVHWGRPLIARHPDALEDGIVNTLSYVAACQPFEKALVIWESAARKQLVMRETLANLPFGPQGRRILSEMSWFSDSGLESVVVPRLRWLGVPLRPQISIAGHRVDLLIGDRLVLQIDGGHHVDAQRSEDNRHDAQLMLMGYHVIRVSYFQVVHRWHEVQDLVATAVAQGLHRIR